MAELQLTERPGPTGVGAAWIRHLPIRAALAAAVGLTVSSCGDPAPSPESAPLEVVVDGCTLNRSSVAAGTHPVTAVGSGSVRILDADGRVAFSIAQESAEVELTEQEYTVVCRAAGGRDRATLTVTAD